MTHQHDHAHDAATASPASATDSELAPGRGSRTAGLVGPTGPRPSGLLMRKRDGNHVADDAEAAVGAAASSTGAALPDDLRSRFEGSLGTDLSGVRVHTGPASASAASAVGAKAYTLGNDIHFGAGHFDTSSLQGQHLLAHEVAHTVQQRGGAPTRQNKLEVSSPGDAFEHEADRAADAMLSGQAATAGSAGRLVSRVNMSQADAMEDGANAGGKEVASSAPPALASMSSLETVAQAKQCIAKVIAANGNLNVRKAAQTTNADDAKEFSEERAKILADAKRTGELLEENEKVIGTLQHLVDLGEGNSQQDDQGNRPGHDMRLKAFAQLAQAALVDFGRLQGTVRVFLDDHAMKEDGRGAAGGARIGGAVATDGKGGDLAAVKGKIDQATAQDPKLAAMMGEYKAAFEALNDTHADTDVNASMTDCASAVSKLRNVKVNVNLGTSRPDTAEQKAAAADVAKVNAELAEAKGAFDKAGDVAMLAISVMGMPEIGILGAGSSLAPLTESATSKTVSKVAGTADKIAGGAAKVTGDSIKTQVSTDISTAVGKMVTDYDSKISVANGHVQQANDNAKRQFVTLDKNLIAVAKGDVIAAFHKLSMLCGAIEDKKFALRAKANKINEYQRSHRKPGQPDIGAITKALAETTAFIKQADTAALQGEEEQKIAKEMAKTRQEVSGQYGKGTQTGTEMSDVKEIGVATKDDAFVDCEPAAPFLLSRHPLSFRINSDKANDHVEVAGMEAAGLLASLKEKREAAVGMEGALKQVLGF